MDADEADQFVAAIDGHDGEGVRIDEAVHDERLDVRLEVGEDGVGGDELVPGLEVELGFRGAGRARVERDDPAGDLADEEEGQADRDLEGGPDLIRQDEVGRRLPSPARMAMHGSQAQRIWRSPTSSRWRWSSDIVAPQRSQRAVAGA